MNYLIFLGVLLLGKEARAAIPLQHARVQQLCGNVSTTNYSVYGHAKVHSATQQPDALSCCQRCAAEECAIWYFRQTDGGTTGECKLYLADQVSSLKAGSCSSVHNNVKCASSPLPQPPPPPPTPPPPPPPPPVPPPSSVLLSVGAICKWTISPYLASMSLVYAWARDAAGYKNGTIATWATENRLETARYPAGMASYWNWESPSGEMGNSSLSADWIKNKRQPAPAADWMSFEEYLSLCKASNLRPLIGVNYNCHNYQKCDVPLNLSVARAVRQVQFAVQRGFTGAFWYIGNEDDAGKIENTLRIAEHVRAMKAVDPTLKAFWNDNDIQPSDLRAFLKATGSLMDGAEFHGKWPYGGTPKGFPPASLKQFLNEVPLLEHKSGQSWREKIANLRDAAVAAGRPEFLLANNEYGLGKPELFMDPGFTRYTRGLIIVELALEMYASGYDIAAFWDNGDGQTTETKPWGEGHMLLDTSAGFRMNPMVFGLNLLAKSTGACMLPLSTSANRVHGFAARSNSSASGAVEYFLINKFQAAMPVEIHDVTATVSTLESMIDTDDHWGTIATTSNVTCSKSASVCSFVLPPLSFTRIF